MPQHPDQARARARNSRTEAVLREVESGSVPHVLRLATTHWPGDPHDAAVALQVLFDLLFNETMPIWDATTESIPESPEVKQLLKRIRHTMAAIKRSTEHLQREGWSANSGPLGQVFERNMPTLVRWLDFLHRRSRWVYSDATDPECAGPKAAVEIIGDLYRNGSGVVMKRFTATEEAMDLLLSLWIWRTSRGESLTFQFHSKREPCQVTDLLTFLYTVPDSRNLLVQTMRTYPPVRQRQFIKSALLRTKEWTALKRTTPLQNLAVFVIRVVGLVQEFLEIPSFGREYIKADFPAQVLTLSLEFPDLPSSPSVGGQPGRIDPDHPRYPAAVLEKFFPNAPGGTPAYLIHRVVPALLDAGLLDILVDHLLSQPPGTPYPWHPWVGKDPTGHPLPVLASMCVSLPIRNSCRLAVQKIPVEKLRKLTSGWYAQHWTPFSKDYHLYDHLWMHWFQGGDRVRICDNLNHYKKAKRGIYLEVAKECTRCRTKVYCSSECQREDWERFHKVECPKNRQYRIERQIATAWPSHRDRAFYLSILLHFVLNYEVGARTEVSVGRPVEDGSVFEFLHPNSAWEPPLENLEWNSNSVLHVNTLFSPPENAIHSVESVLRLTHCGVPTFRDPRFLKVFDELEGTQLAGQTSGAKRFRVAMCTTACGLHRIYTFGRFMVSQDTERTRVELLNGYAKVEERAKVENPLLHSFSRMYPGMEQWLTQGSR